MHILGIDLSGPKNIADTYAALFREQGSSLHFIESLAGADDRQILDTVSGLGKSDPVIIGIDAPLSYNAGGGDRPSDTELRRLVRERGGGVGIMPPTMIRMVYLTLRGVALARMLETLKPRISLRIVEVHPGAAMLLRASEPRASKVVSALPTIAHSVADPGALPRSPTRDRSLAQNLRTIKRDPLARFQLLDWLATKGLHDVPPSENTPDHFVMACAAALAAWDWAYGKPAWRFPAQPPAHPYDLAC